jgi:hypothetical protein
VIVEIKAKFSCDECGTEFVVSMDPSFSAPPDLTLFDLAEDAISSGRDYEDGHEPSMGYTGSVDDGRHLCGRCTHEADQE